MKKCRKVTRLSRPLDLALKGHLQSGLGFYQQLCLRIQLEMDLSLDEAWLDFGRCEGRGCPDGSGGLGTQRAPQYTILHRETTSDAVKEWAANAIHHCLVYMGDLC